LRLTRRAFLAGAGAVSLAIPRRAEARPAVPEEPTAITVSATPIDSFSTAEPERRTFGSLTFRGGLQLQSSFEGFGGFSGLWRSPRGDEIVALSDNTEWLTARVVSAQGRLTGLADAVIAPLLAPDGKLLRRTRSYDTEGLTMANGVAYVSIERTQEVMRFNWAKDGVRARAQPVPVPAEAKRLPSNKGLEAIGMAPAKSPLAGALVVIAEEANGANDAPTRGFILTGSRQGAFDVARYGGYDVTDVAFLPSGEMLLLERRVSLLRGFGARIRRMAANAIYPGASVDGPVIFEADSGNQIDNMEGMALHRDGSGETIVSLISDDNFSALQRTVFLEFALSG
jgi:hypothetical protein